MAIWGGCAHRHVNCHMGWEDIYEKLEVIGEGTYGEVHACRHRKTGQAVAIKLLKMVLILLPNLVLLCIALQWSCNVVSVK